MEEKRKQEIIAKLLEREAKLPCPRCGNNNFSIVDGYFSDTIQANLGVYTLGGLSIPTAGVVCNRCGFLSQHALGSLDLLPKEPEKK